MATIDLKPLSKETIDKMGFNNHDLWLVKINDETMGPFETQGLKYYVLENEELFENALASRLDPHDFQPIWNHAIFQRRGPQVLSHDSHEGPFWVLDLGQKHGPFSSHDIDKRIEMNLLSMTDHISTDEGHTWKKIYELHYFDRRTHTVDELPLAPTEASFQKAKLVLIEQQERTHFHAHEELATLTHEIQKNAKILTLNLDELTLRNLKKTEVSSSLKWAIPGAAAALVTLFMTGHFLMTPGNSVDLVTDLTPEVTPKKAIPNPSRQMPRGEIPQGTFDRAPASVRAFEPPAPSYSEDNRYPTYMETHEDVQYDEPQIERDPLDGPVTDAEQVPVQEHSLVGNQYPTEEHQSLDAAMNGVVQPVDPIIEEASDF